MENLLGFDPFIVRQLQQAATDGKSATQLLELWKSAVEALGKDSTDRMRMRSYFDEAFRWSFRESRALTVWWPFSDTPWSDQAINNNIAPLLEEWQASPRITVVEAAEEFSAPHDDVRPGRWVEIQTCAFTGAMPVWVPEQHNR